MSEDEEESGPHENLPIFRKGREIFELSFKIADLVDEQDTIQEHIKLMILEDAALLSAKVAGAEAADLYDIRMENATLIRKAARDLVNHCHSLEMYGFKETHYLHLIRESVEAYRLLFVDWVNNFDPWNAIPDRWGLFNPPGIDPDNLEEGPDE